MLICLLTPRAQTASHDPLLDDSIEFKKKLTLRGATCSLHVLDGLHHGFLNFVSVSRECQKASKVVTLTIKTLLANAKSTPTHPANSSADNIDQL
jgi:acetyl esterase/lipase